MPEVSISQAKKLKIPKHSLQTILISKQISKKDAIKWLKENNLRYDYYRTTINNMRFMQINPIEGANFYTKKINPYINFVYQEY